MSKEQRIRAILYYLSLFIFIAGLPFILSFALGYKLNPKTLRFTKTGIISLKTQPDGASVYLDGRLLQDKTPNTIHELLPGEYNLRIKLEKYYQWFGTVHVEAGKVSKLERIILFPLRPDVKQLNIEKISSFWADSDKSKIYYLNQEEGIIYRSDLEGGNFEEIGVLPEINSAPKKWKVSPDRKKLLYFSPRQIAVAYLENNGASHYSEEPIVQSFSNFVINDIFWHSDSYHLIIVTDRNIEAMEASFRTPAVKLLNLNKRNAPCYYNENKDELFFLDSERAEDGRLYDNVYKLELNAQISPFQGLIRQNANER